MCPESKPLNCTQYVVFFPQQLSPHNPQITYKTATHIPLFPVKRPSNPHLSMAFSMRVGCVLHRQLHRSRSLPTGCELWCESILPVCGLALPSHSSRDLPRGQLVDDPLVIGTKGLKKRTVRIWRTFGG